MEEQSTDRVIFANSHSVKVNDPTFVLTESTDRTSFGQTSTRITSLITTGFIATLIESTMLISLAAVALLGDGASLREGVF